MPTQPHQLEPLPPSDARLEQRHIGAECAPSAAIPARGPEFSGHWDRFYGRIGRGDEMHRGDFKSDAPQGKVRFGLLPNALRFIVPRLWPEAGADAASLHA